MSASHRLPFAQEIIRLGFYFCVPLGVLYAYQHPTVVKYYEEQYKRENGVKDIDEILDKEEAEKRRRRSEEDLRYFQTRELPRKLNQQPPASQ